MFWKILLAIFLILFGLSLLIPALGIEAVKVALAILAVVAGVLILADK